METLLVQQFHAGEVTDMKIERLNERDLEVEMFGKKTQKEIIDAFEENHGIKPAIRNKKKNFINKVQIFDISIPEDKKLFEFLQNSPRYYVTHFKDNFNVKGEYRVVCYYIEDLDSKSPPFNTEEPVNTTST